MLKQNCTWIAKQGKISKVAPKLELFPKLKIEVFLVEFRDTLYDLVTGQVIGFDEIPTETATFCYINKKLDLCIPPYNTIGLLWTLMNLGREESKERQKLLKISFEDCDAGDLLVLKNGNRTFNGT